MKKRLFMLLACGVLSSPSLFAEAAPKFQARALGEMSGKETPNESTRCLFVEREKRLREDHPMKPGEPKRGGKAADAKG